MKKKFRRLSSSILLASSAFAPSAAEAKMPPNAFKGISEFFLKKSYDPTVGEAALESGFIESLRLDGDFEYGEENGERRFIKDKSQDPVWKFLKELFPSPAGHLTIETEGNKNFARLLKTPKGVALMLNYVHALRAESEKNSKSFLKIKSDIQDALFEELFSKDEKEKKEKLKNYIKSLIESRKTLEENKFENQEKLEKTKKLIGLLEKAILNTLKTFMLADDFPKESYEQINKFLEEGKDLNNIETIIEKNLFKKRFDAAKEILKLINGAVDEEKKAFYPPHTTEQIITAFFCEKFSEQSEIFDLIRELDKQIVDKNKQIPLKGDILKKDDFEEIYKKKTVKIDDLFDIFVEQTFFSMIPFKSGSHLSSNGSTERYDRKSDKLLPNKTFQDCAEISGRHIFSMLLYDRISNSYDLSFIESYMKNNESRYFKNFKEFFEKYSPGKANSGARDVRSDWNRVVGDLNDKNDLSIQYLSGNNELTPGFVNFVNVFSKVFNLKLAPFPFENQLLDQKKWLKNSFVKIFTLVNPRYDYQLDLDSVRGGKDKNGMKDLAGSLKIKILDKENKKELFSFKFDVWEDLKHAFVHTVKDKLQETYLKTLKPLGKEISEDVDVKTAQDIIHLLVKTKDVSHPLYTLFQRPLTDNESRVDFLKNFITLSSANGEFVKSHQKRLKTMLGHVLDDIGWDDSATVKIASPHVLTLAQNQFFRDVVFEKVGALQIDKNTDLLLQFKKIQNLALNNSKIKSLTFPQTFKNMEFLSVQQSEITDLNLAAVENLTRVNIQNAPLQSIVFGEKNKFVESLEICGGNIKNSLDVLDASPLESLKTLKLFDNPLLKSFIFGEKNKKLEEFELWDSAVEEVDFSSLKGIKTIHLKGNKKLRSITLGEDHKDLEDLTILDSAITKLDEVSFFKSLVALKDLSLRNDQLKELTFSKSNTALFDFSLSQSLIEELDVSPLTGLQKFSLYNNSNLKTLTFGQNSKIEMFNCNGSEDLRLMGLSHLKNLKSVTIGQDIFNEKVVKGITFEDEMTIGHLKLKLKGLKSKSTGKDEEEQT
ncbi:Leucine-rich repeat domain-containing protein [Candidatus Bealeia paramacronuclearis]|uniref:Leucine-rich repeat domain-containing protein n=1 Tax=Candidatus Bealeia paramacronuclearis TaxID=1921001 RepID=A0ABZ2C3S1_9PROT|nr:Leucine-rich repeat domain-containing protein [Candidatus Bealeia paramacronuclearis]